MFSKFFIDRPIFAAVLSIIIVMAGGLTMYALPVAQYPNIAPPTVVVSANYPGADAKVVAETVAAPIEEQVNGVEGMLYMESNCSNDGQYSLTVTFETGTDLDIAAVMVQNRVAAATNGLPDEVTRLGVTTKKSSSDFALMIQIIDTSGQYDDIFLSNYASLYIKDELSRLEGAGDVRVMGAGDYSMRVWLDPDKLQSLALTVTDVIGAIQEQNVQVAAGTIGLPPSPKGQAFQYTVTAQGRLTTAEQFSNIVVKSGDDGRLTRLKDVARVELGSESYLVATKLNGKPTALARVDQLPGANVLSLSQRAKAKMAELAKEFPQGLEYVISYDAANVVQASVNEIVMTLFIAAILVIITVFVFLQDWRATVIPAVTIPVSLIGTFLVMSLLGFTINTLTLFGLVLAIGIVVDDAIVVVENVARNIDDHNLGAHDAAIRAMREVSGPVVATTLVLLAVFVPTAFMGGLTGVLYKQFALTIATATLFSSINALTLSPALCALVLRPTPQRRNIFWRLFNSGLARTTSFYLGAVGLLTRRLVLAGVLFLALSGVAGWGLVSLPTAFVPQEDQGYLLVNVQLPDAASLERTLAVTERVNKVIQDVPGVKYNIAVNGYSFLDSAVASNAASCVVVLDDWDKRTTPQTQMGAIQGRIMAGLSQIQEAQSMAFQAPPLPGLGLSSGFELQLQDRGGAGLDELQRVAYQYMMAANQDPGLTGVYTTFRANVPQLRADVDRAKVKSMGLELSSVFNTLQAFLGSSYVNDFNLFGRTYQVRVQADSRFRAQPEDIYALQVRNPAGQMLPLGTLVKVEQSLGPQLVNRFNMFPSATMRGNAAEGYSSGDAMNSMERLAARVLPSTMGIAWSGASYQEKLAGSQGTVMMLLAVVFVFLVLAAQYESWKVPVPVVLAVPMAILGAVAAIWVRQMDNNVYTQIGLVLLVGLATKNAILIVEFAHDRYVQGMGAAKAALEASRLRFRPILMTAFSFILGVAPLVVADGAGAASRQALGTAVFGGMLAATLIGVVVVPPMYVIFERLGWKRQKDEAEQG